jgi:nitrogen fixation/metabolism regulation signal transduction histidine kinase
MEEMLSSLLGDDVIFQMSLTEGALPVKVDVPQMEQAIMNLVINARDSLEAASPEEKRLTIKTASVSSAVR